MPAVPANPNPVLVAGAGVVVPGCPNPLASGNPKGILVAGVEAGVDEPNPPVVPNPPNGFRGVDVSDPLLETKNELRP